MPELPELQALAERLHALVSGATLDQAFVLGFSSLKTFDPSPDALGGRTLERVGRRGKYLIFEFSGMRVLVHLSQGGRVEIEARPRGPKGPRGAVVRFTFRDRPGVLVREYGTERKAGWWVLRPGDDGPLERLGPEPDAAEFQEYLRTAADGRRLHTLLRDQRTVAGIGRGFADDILHEAQLSPYLSLARATAGERARLGRAVPAVLGSALDGERKRTGGLPAKLAGRFKVHGRAGEPCPRCGAVLRRVSFESYEIAYCPECQTGGTVLADRRISRLVK